MHVIAFSRRPLARLQYEVGLHLLASFVVLACVSLGAVRLFGLPAAFVGQAMLAFGVIAILLLGFLHTHLPRPHFGPANRVTLVRAMILALVAGLIGTSHVTSAIAWLVVGLALLVLALDGIDGWLARRFEDASRFGARFDMEVDAALILVMSVLVSQFGKTGEWIRLGGLLRYGYVAMQRLVPALRRPLAPSLRRKVACVVQVLGLSVCLAPLVTGEAATIIAGAALAFLVYSFAVDIARQLFWMDKEG